MVTVCESHVQWWGGVVGLNHSPTTPIKSSHTKFQTCKQEFAFPNREETYKSHCHEVKE